jgi:hypothetical protein
MLPVSVVMVYFLISASGFFELNLLWTVPFMVLTYGFFIWGPSMLMTYLLESIILSKESSLQQVILVFTIETGITFLIIGLLFGGLSSGIPFLALGMSVVIQICRVFYIRHKLNVIKKKEQLSNEGGHLRLIK